MPVLSIRVNQIQGIPNDSFVFWICAGTTEQCKVEHRNGVCTVPKLFEFNYNNNFGSITFSIRKGSLLIGKLILPVDWLPRFNLWVSDWFPLRDPRDGSKCLLAQIDLQICDTKRAYFDPNFRGCLTVAPAWNRPGAPAIPPGPPPPPGAPPSTQPGYYLQSQAISQVPYAPYPPCPQYAPPPPQSQPAVPPAVPPADGNTLAHYPYSQSPAPPKK